MPIPHRLGPAARRWWPLLAGLLLIALSAVVWPPTAPAGSCALDGDGEAAVSVHVYDGDTLQLADGRRLRLLGINTPELGRDGGPSQPLAAAAASLLSELAGPGVRLRLRGDVEARDKYGRMLAHAFLDNGDNVQERLLAAGYATTLVVPPNEWASECYAAVESRARAQRAGVWSLPEYQPVPAEALAAGSRGFRLISGRVQRIGEGAGSVWLNLSSRVAIRIPQRDLDYFRDWDPRALRGRQVEVRGWVQQRKGQLRVSVHHPAAMRLLD